MSFTVWLIRTLFNHGDKKRDKGLVTPEDVTRYDDIQYSLDSTWNLLDLYKPKDKEDLLPVIISIHGGGWVYGTKETYQFYAMELARKGFAVINFSYRLAPEFPYPSQLEDTNSVVKWVFKYAKEYHLDIDHIYLVGDSAGAQLTAMYCNLYINKEYATNFHLNLQKEFKPKAIALNCGVYYVSDAVKKNHLGFRKTIEQYLGKDNFMNKVRLQDIMPFMTEDFPPTFLMTANKDFLKNQAPFMEERLRELNIPYEYKCYGDDDTKLKHVFHLNIKTASAAICNQDELLFFHQFE